jgi:hypothetical protein
VPSWDIVTDLTPEEFTHLLLIAAAPPHRVGEVVARLVGDDFRIGPIPVGPGGVASATAYATRGQVHVAMSDDPDWHQIVTVPISLSVEVRLGNRAARYRGALQVQTRLRLRLTQPCNVKVEIDDLTEDDIRTAIEPIGTAARVVDCVGGVEGTVAEQVLDYVEDLMSRPEFDDALDIDVIQLMQRAWDAGLVVDLPDGS